MTQRDFHYALRLFLYTYITGKCIEVPLLISFQTFVDMDLCHTSLPEYATHLYPP